MAAPAEDAGWHGPLIETGKINVTLFSDLLIQRQYGFEIVNALISHSLKSYQLFQQNKPIFISVG